jgi:PAS domain S-box-containing protein
MASKRPQVVKPPRKAKLERGTVAAVPASVGARIDEEIVASIPVALVVWQLDDVSNPNSLRLTAINHEASRIMQMSADQAVGKLIEEILPRIADTGLPQIYAQVVRSGQAQDIDEIRYGDSSLPDAYYRLRIFPLAGNRVGVTFEDISVRKQAEETLRQIVEGISPATGEDFFRALVNYLTRSCQIDLALVGRLDSENADQIQTIAGSRQGSPIENFTYGLADTPCENVVGHVFCHFPSGVQQQFPKDLMLVDMGIDSYMGMPLFSSQGKPIGLLAMLHDKPFTQPEQAKVILHVVAARAAAEIERQQAEEALRSSEAFLSMTQRVGNVGSWQWDLRTNRVRWSECMFSLYGLSPDQFDGTLSGATSTTHPDDVPAMQECIRKLVEESIGSPFEYRVIRQSGEIGYLWGLGEVIRDASGAATHVVGTVVDMTARKQAEAERQKLAMQIQQAQKLESLGVLAGGIAHDFNNILTGILGYADLALQELPAHAPARHLIGEAAKGARRAADLTNQLLAYSGKGRFVLSALNLNEVVKDMAQLLQVSIPKKCELRYNFMANLPAIEADPSQVRQIVMNLIINAAEAIGDRSGVIALTTGVMDCDQVCLTETYLHEGAPTGLYVYLEVADTGCGMSDETRARIFEPFFTSKFTGRGLGLAAVLGIVRGHHGLINVQSELGKGTTFKIAFPATSASASIEPSRSAVGPTWRGHGVILVVDDEESIRSLAKRMLERMGFAVVTANDGREALDIFRKQPNEIRLVLLDMTMPRLDGEETFRELCRIRGDIKAILSSGYDEQSATSRFTGKGLTGFVQKPYTYEQLMTACRTALGNEG